MITLIVFIVVILIVAGVTFRFSKDIIKENELKTDITNMLLIQARTEVLYDRSAFDDGVALVGENIVLNDENRALLVDTYKIVEEELIETEETRNKRK